MPKISVFGGVTDVRASGLLPGVADELPVEVVDRADGTVTEVNSEHDQDATPDNTRSPNADTTGAPEFTVETGRPDDADPGMQGDPGDPPADPIPNPGDSGKSDDSDENGKRDNKDSRVNGDADLPFDPSEFTVAEVKEKLEGMSEDDRDRVIDAERLSSNRKGITG